MCCLGPQPISPITRARGSPAPSSSILSAQAFRERWQRARHTMLGVTRLGLDAGPAIVGNFGGGRYFDYTAYGDTVNTAARLEAANKQLGTRICVGESVASRVAGSREGRSATCCCAVARNRCAAFEPLSAEAFDDPDPLLSRRIRQARSRGSGGDAGFRRAARAAQRGSSGWISPKAPAQRRRWSTNRPRMSTSPGR